MIGSLEPGEPLPGQPPGPFGLSEVLTLREIMSNPNIIAKPLVQCLTPQLPHPSLGWAQAGELCLCYNSD